MLLNRRGQSWKEKIQKADTENDLGSSLNQYVLDKIAFVQPVERLFG